MREYLLRREYGLDMAGYDALFEKCGGVCTICKQRIQLVVDHCHKTGRVRGLLCSVCNRGLGMFKDKPNLLRSAAEYLENS